MISRVLREADADGYSIAVRYAINEDRTHPYFLEAVRDGQWILRQRFRTLKAACDYWLYQYDDQDE